MDLNAEVREIAYFAGKLEGWSHRKADNGHWEIRRPDGHKLQFGSTPKDSVAVKNTRARARRFGVPFPDQRKCNKKQRESRDRLPKIILETVDKGIIEEIVVPSDVARKEYIRDLQETVLMLVGVMHRSDWHAWPLETCRQLCAEAKFLAEEGEPPGN